MSPKSETLNWLNDPSVEPDKEGLSVWRCDGYILDADGGVIECPLTIEAGVLFQALQEYRGHTSYEDHVDPRTGELIPLSYSKVGLKPK